ncbi:MAG: ABC transporter permease subunit [Christensenella sp.]|uniref:ABC transporter permease n=1 Tax=Christensenella sp. TaxID=1935934 RepID=UPI002B203F29|nr:ABC transporter permease subunit [Christensenella sp.]MEA5003473.1 ABC transporter permease subunit [Christensenella sp.]
MKAKDRAISIKNEKIIRILGPILLLIILLAVLQLVTTIGNVPNYMFPKPSVVFETFAQNLVPKILPAAGETLTVVLIGYAIGAPIGIMLAAMMSQFKLLNKAFSPYVILLVCTPLISLVPMLMLWMGYGMNVRIIGVIIQVFPIVMMNSFTGFNNVEHIKLELMQSMGAKRFTTFFRVTFFDALPHVFTGLKLGTIFATITAVSTEGVSGNMGLGHLMMEAKGVLRTDMMFATIIICAIIGITLYSLVNLAEKKIIKWKK